jgi:uncharacterized protein YraI
MTISRKRHYWTVAAISTACLALGVVLASTFLYTKPTDDPAEPPKISERSFLDDEEVVVISAGASSTKDTILTVEKVLFKYVEVTDGCGTHFEGDCLLVRSGPGTDFPVVYRLRNGVVLKVAGEVEREGALWYKIIFDEWLRYPERITGDWYVAADFVEALYDEGDRTIWEDEYTTSPLKKIIVDRKEQKLTAYEDDTVFMEIPISTGLELTPTPKGTFTIFKKTPSRYMQGPLPGLADQQSYDLPGVPWNLYFTHGGAVIHGAYWHNSFGSQYSHGCVNLAPNNARTLYYWAELGTQVIVKN